MRIAAVILQATLWLWFLGCVTTYRFGKILLVEGMGVRSAEFAMLCLYSAGLVAYHCFPAGRWVLAGILLELLLIFHDGAAHFHHDAFFFFNDVLPC